MHSIIDSNPLGGQIVRARLMTVLIMSVMLFSLPMKSFGVTTKPFPKVGTYALTFLKIGVSARATAMGDAFIALANDGAATYWNPAGMVDLTKTSVSLNHTFWMADIDLDYASGVFTLPFVPGTFGVSARALTLDPQIVRTIERPEGTGQTFDAGDMSFGVSYAKFFTDKFSSGVTLHFVHSGLADQSVNTLAVDFGLIYRIGFRGMRLGMMIQSLGSKVDYDNRASKIPTLFKVGLAMAAYERGVHSLTSVGEFSHPSDNKERVNVGMEYAYNQFFYLRSGYNVGYDASGAAAGFGLRIDTSQTSDIGFDYAWTDMAELGYIHRLSLAFSY